MTWTAPDVERTRPAYVADERTSLEGWLDFHRQTLLSKCAGLTAEQLKLRPLAPSALSLLGLVRHMTDVERWWFRMNACGQDVQWRHMTDEDLDADFGWPPDADAEADLAAFREEVEFCRAAVAALPLDHVFESRRSYRMDLRWVYTNMVEEYARHNGHADLLRELIDGVTGD